MNYGKIFWGVILILIGILFALKNFGVFFFSWWEILELWPLLLVFWGIGLLPVKSGVKLLLTVAALAIGLATVDFAPGYNYDRYDRFHNWRQHDNDRDRKEWREQKLTLPFEDGIDNATLKLEAAAGDFYVGGQTEKLVDFRRDGNLDYSLTVDDRPNGKKVRIKLRESVFRSHSGNEVDIKLHEKPVWDFDLDIGAASMKMDLSEYKLNDIDIDGGASSIDLRIGKLSEKINVEVDAGASSVKIRIPEEAGCELRTSSFLTSKSLEGLDKVDSQHYRSDGFDDAQQKIYIRLDAAITSLKVLRY